MTQTTTAINACNVKIFVDDADGNPQDVSGSSNQSSLGFSRQMGSAFTFDGDYPIRIECKKDASLEISALYTRQDGEARDIFESWYEDGGRRTVTIYPYGQDTGNRYYTGEWRLEELNIPLDGSDPNPVVLTITCVPDGHIDFLKWAS